MAGAEGRRVSSLACGEGGGPPWNEGAGHRRDAIQTTFYGPARPPFGPSLLSPGHHSRPAHPGSSRAVQGSGEDR